MHQTISGEKKKAPILVTSDRSLGFIIISLSPNLTLCP